MVLTVAVTMYTACGSDPSAERSYVLSDAGASGEPPGGAASSLSGGGAAAGERGGISAEGGARDVGAAGLGGNGDDVGASGHAGSGKDDDDGGGAGCPEFDSERMTALDTDGDGYADHCDDDDDDDGYPDIFDSAPGDPRFPGGFPISAPGAIVNHACMQAALAEAAPLADEEGYHPLWTLRTRNAVPVSGYFVRTDGTGWIIGANDGAIPATTVTGAEERVDHVSGDLFDTVAVAFSGNTRYGYGIGRHRSLRGGEGHFVAYGATYGALDIFAFSVDEQGRYEGGVYLVVTIPPGGSHDECPESHGKWRLSWWPERYRIDDAEDLQFMCKHEGRGFVPTENWLDSEQQRCRCSLEYTVSCSP